MTKVSLDYGTEQIRCYVFDEILDMYICQQPMVVQTDADVTNFQVHAVCYLVGMVVGVQANNSKLVLSWLLLLFVPHEKTLTACCRCLHAF